MGKKDAGYTLVQKGNRFYFRKRVPKIYKSIEQKTEIFIALGTDSEREAMRKAMDLRDQYEAIWHAKLHGQDLEAEARVQSAIALASARGYRYKPAAQVADLPLEEIMARVRETMSTSGNDPTDLQESDALLGGAGKDTIRLSGVFERIKGLEPHKWENKSPDQYRRWKNERTRALRKMIEVLGDLQLHEITKTHARTFRDWWREEIAWSRDPATGEIRAPKVGATSGHKDFSLIKRMLKVIDEEDELDLDLETKVNALRMEPGDAKERKPFSDDWIGNHLLKEGALDGLNDQARDIFLLMINTGMRPGEISSLTEDRIHLNDTIPFVRVDTHDGEDGRKREVKTKTSKRDVPLTGVSLEAAKRNPKGFPRYFDKPGLSTTVNKYLKNNGLKEDDSTTMYSLRHSLEDRMVRADIDERIRRDVMGHTLGRERYGQAGGLAHIHKLLSEIAF